MISPAKDDTTTTSTNGTKLDYRLSVGSTPLSNTADSFELFLPDLASPTIDQREDGGVNGVAKVAAKGPQKVTLEAKVDNANASATILGRSVSAVFLPKGKLPKTKKTGSGTPAPATRARATRAPASTPVRSPERSLGFEGRARHPAGASRYGGRVVHSARMDFDLSDEQRLLRDTVRDFARQEVAPVAEELDRTKSFPYELVDEDGEARPDGHPVPRAVRGRRRRHALLRAGGGGADPDRLLGRDHDGRAHLARARCRSTSGAPTSRRTTGCRSSAAGEKLAAFGLTEPEAGSDAGNTKTTAKLDGGEWVVNGAKQFITNSGTDISGCVTITAVTGNGNGAREISNLIVPNGTPGYEAGEPYRKMGWNASDTRPLTFDDARVPEGNLLGRRGDGFKQFMQILDGGRIGVAAMGVGLAQGALDEAISYAKERRAFGQPISKFQAIQAKIADLSAQIEASRLLVYRAAIEKDRGDPSPSPPPRRS